MRRRSGRDFDLLLDWCVQNWWVIVFGLINFLTWLIIFVSLVHYAKGDL